MTTYPIHEALMQTAAYPDQTTRVEFLETHVSRLYFTDSRVYKIKKAVNLGFLDFESLASRLHFCHEEIRLNSRYCPSIYIGTLPVTRQGGEVRIGGKGELLDYAVAMKRLPAERMLSSLLESRAPELEQEIDRLAERLGDIYDGLEIYRGEEGQRNADFMHRNWQENFEQIEPFIGRTITAEAFATGRLVVERFFAENETMLLDREKRGYVRDCHGDLHCGNICMTDPICIYDCIEFNRRFRLGDVACDLAFLLMDLDFRGHHRLGQRLLDRLSTTLGPESELSILVPHFKLYRAWVRGKVTSFLLNEQELSNALRKDSLATASRYFNLGLGTLCPPGLILTCGLMGCGKTTVAKALVAATGATLHRSDVIRKQLHGITLGQEADTPFGEGIYSQQADEAVYDELLRRCETDLSKGRLVIADAAFGGASNRQRFMQLADRLGAHRLLLMMSCERDQALSRLDRRQQLGEDASDGRRELYDLQAEKFQPPGADEDAMVVDTTQEVDYNVGLIISRYLHRSGVGT